MEFEFDATKSKSNRIKHGIDFVQAQALWQDGLRYVVPARVTGESRFAMIARIDETFWTAIYTLRGDNIRIISVRRARDEEKEIYYQNC